MVENNEPKAAAEKPIKSPCVSICVLNDDDICTGCYRSGDEISHWGKFNNDQKRQVHQCMQERAKKMNPFL